VSAVLVARGAATVLAPVPPLPRVLAVLGPYLEGVWRVWRDVAADGSVRARVRVWGGGEGVLAVRGAYRRRGARCDASLPYLIQG